MISAKQARENTEKSLKTNCHICPKVKLLEINKNKEFYIPLPFKLKAIEEMIETEIEFGNSFVNIYNEITEETERELIDNGFKVKYYKRFIKISW